MPAVTTESRSTDFAEFNVQRVGDHERCIICGDYLGVAGCSLLT